VKKLKFCMFLILVACAGCVSVPEGYTKYDGNLSGKIYRKRDARQGVVFYRHSNSFSKAPMKLYVVQESKRYMVLEFEHFSAERLNFSRAHVQNARGMSMGFTFSSGDKSIIHNNRSFIETADRTLNTEQISKLRSLLMQSGGRVQLKLIGNQTKEFNLSNSHIQGMLDMITFF
jgi:hypothetical protein